jgi:hypothetical protein
MQPRFQNDRQLAFCDLSDAHTVENLTGARPIFRSDPQGPWCLTDSTIRENRLARLNFFHLAKV